MFKFIFYMFLAFVATGLAIAFVISFKIIGFILGILLSVMCVAGVIFLIFIILIHKPSKDDNVEINRSKEEFKDPHTREFK